VTGASVYDKKHFVAGGLSGFDLMVAFIFAINTVTMNEIISSYLENQTCANICSVDSEGLPYCFSCFYLFDKEKGLLYFKSSPDTFHAKCLIANGNVAGTILPDKLDKLKVKGLQFKGEVFLNGQQFTSRSAQLYHRHFPMALVIPGEIWTIKLSCIKFTDSTLGFGRKLHWEAEKPVELPV
jgi:hypothetical protein